VANLFLLQKNVTCLLAIWIYLVQEHRFITYHAYLLHVSTMVSVCWWTFLF